MGENRVLPNERGFMKKLRALSNLWPLELSKGKGVLIITLALGFAFWTATSGAEGQEQGKGKGKGGGKGGKDKCIVCHNEHNFHEISIPCDKVDKYLRHHPGDHAGPCQVTSVTNP
jgi:hypothetical protein